MTDPLETRKRRVSDLWDLLMRLDVLRSHRVLFLARHRAALARVIADEKADIARAEDARGTYTRAPQGAAPR